MADQYHVEDALLENVTATLYPSGPANTPALGTPCRIHRGWPMPQVVDADLARGMVTVAISPVDGSQRLTTRYPEEWLVTAAIEPTLIATVTADQVRLSGTTDPNQLIGILADSRTAVLRTKTGDTLAHIAANLAQQLRAHHIVQYSGTSLIVPGVHDLRARVVADQPARRELRRQSQAFRVACFCPTPALRDAAASLIDTALARIRFLPLADGTSAHLTHENTVTLDNAEHAFLYRRDLVLRAEYPTTDTAMLPALLFGAGSVNAAPFIG